MGTFIPKQYKKEPITIRVPTQRLEEIDRLAAKYNTSRNGIINQCIDYALEDLPKE